MLSISIQVAENGTISTFLIAVWYSIEGMRLERRERIFWYVVIIELFHLLASFSGVQFLSYQAIILLLLQQDYKIIITRFQIL